MTAEATMKVPKVRALGNFKLVNKYVCWEEGTPQRHGDRSPFWTLLGLTLLYLFMWLCICILYNILCNKPVNVTVFLSSVSHDSKWTRGGAHENLWFIAGWSGDNPGLVSEVVLGLVGLNPSPVASELTLESYCQNWIELQVTQSVSRDLENWLAWEETHPSGVRSTINREKRNRSSFKCY